MRILSKLHYSWQEKRWLALGLSTSFIDRCYGLALEHGASGGKITGVGSAGFLMLYCHEQAQDAVTTGLEEQGLKRMSFRFDQQGAKVLLNVANSNNLGVAPYAEPALHSYLSIQDLIVRPVSKGIQDIESHQ